VQRFVGVHLFDAVFLLLETKGKGSRIRTKIASASLQDMAAAAKANNTLPNVLEHACWFLASVVDEGSPAIQATLW